MQEMLLVGRGGEGVVVASQILAETFARAGSWVQSFPEFTAERRGAPISCFLRWDSKGPIHRRYRFAGCDVLVFVTPSIPPPEVWRSVRPGGLVVVNHEPRLPLRGPFGLARVPASQIARSHGVVSSEGRPMGNIAVLGACVRLLAPAGLPHLEAAIRARMGALADANIAAAREGYRRCTRQHSLPADAPLELDTIAEPPIGTAPAFAMSTGDVSGIQTGSWSLERPVLQDECTACGVCALFCPEGAISRAGDGMVVDYLHCKGCGICEVVCPVRNAVAMEEAAAA